MYVRRTLRITSLFAFLFLVACGEESVTAKRLRPAPIFLDTHRYVAVAQFDGASGDLVTATLRESLADTGRHHIAKAAKSDLTQSGIALNGLTRRLAGELASALDVTAVVWGRVVETPEVSITSLNQGRNVVDDRDWRVQLAHDILADRIRRSQLHMRVELTAVDRRGATLGTSTVTLSSRVFEERSSGLFDSFSPVDWSSHRQKIMERLAPKLMQQFRPSFETHTFTFYKSSKLPGSQEAVEALHAGQWQNAIALYETGLTHMDASTPAKYRSRARYNLGLSQVLAGKFEQGLEQLRSAHLLAPTDKLRDIIAYCKMYAQEVALARLQLAALGAPIEAEIRANENIDQAPETVLEAPWPTEKDAV